MALTTAQYRTMRDLFRGALSVDSANPTDSDVLSFFKQLLVDANGSVALSSARSFLAGEIARGILSGNFSNPSDANVVDFWNALKTDANAGSAMSSTSAQYITMRKALLGAFSRDFFNPTATDILSYYSTYSTSGPASILGSQPAWWLDGSAGTLVDAGGGVCSQWTDSSGNSVNFTFAGAARPTIITGGLNGKNTLAFAATQYGGNASYASPAPGTILSYFFAIARLVTLADPVVLISQGGGAGQNIYTTNVKALTDNNGLAGAVSPVLSGNTWYRIECLRSNSGTDYVAVNGTVATPGNAGNSASTGVYLNATNAGTAAGTYEYAEVFQWTGASAPTAPMRASLAAYSLSKWGV